MTSSRICTQTVKPYIEEKIITSKIHEGDVISMDIEKDATELTIKIKKHEKPTES